MNKLLQVCSGAVYDEAGDTHFMHDAKLDALASIIDEACGAPVLVAHTFVSERKRLLERFPQAEVISDGSVERWNRGEIPSYWRTPRVQVKGSTCSTGATLWCGSHCPGH